MADDYITETALKDVLLINRPIFEDGRGSFGEDFRIPDIERRLGRPIRIEQQNKSYSTKHVLRGIHIAPWLKIVICTRGQVQQVVVDCRPYSKTFGQHVDVILGDKGNRCVFIPEGCGNSFLTLSDDADFVYDISVEYQKGIEKDLLWNDSTLGISWKNDCPIVSERDRTARSFEQLKRELNV